MEKLFLASSFSGKNILVGGLATAFSSENVFARLLATTFSGKNILVSVLVTAFSGKNIPKSVLATAFLDKNILANAATEQLTAANVEKILNGTNYPIRFNTFTVQNWGLEVRD
ncbi:MAG: hypothetical protein LBU92_01910 [Prevotellaceae bacterium]|jgi:hypothetical protein|nr:hypothetical protein [Prevotellaceae bacterium]